MSFEPKNTPHRRFNPLTSEWVIVSPHRINRPWKGQVEKPTKKELPLYDKNCYLCPCNTRSTGIKNPKYANAYVFTNDFQAIFPSSHSLSQSKNPLFKISSISGTCRVVCFSPQHNVTLAEMSKKEIKNVIDVWIQQLEELGKVYRWIQIFENKGEIMGTSNPHPHCQIWATNFLPTIPAKEDLAQKKYFKKCKSVLLIDYLKNELTKKERVTLENAAWVVITPYWAVWPFETMLLSRSHITRLQDINEKQKDSLSKILKMLLIKYDNLFKTSFPYSMGLHTAPSGRNDCSYWQLHFHLYPPLLRSAAVKKFMVGYEMLAENQRDLTPEQATQRLRETSNVHYKTK